VIESPIRLAVSWMTDGALGLNAQLATVPRPNGESAPPACLFADELANAWVSRNIIPPDAMKDPNDGTWKPLVIIRFPELDDSAQLEHPVLPQQLVNEAGIVVPVAVEYVRRKIAAQAQPTTHATMVREARQTIRAAIRVLAKRFDSELTTYEVDQCVIGIASSGVQFAGRYADTADAEVLDRIVIPFVVLDRWALGLVDP
jgi:hypothetical protein